MSRRSRAEAAAGAYQQNTTIVKVYSGGGSGCYGCFLLIVLAFLIFLLVGIFSPRPVP